jgi:predicted dehydrogenase
MTITRRSFLQASAAATAALAAPAVHGQAKPGKKYKTALIGSGWWGKVITEMAMAHGSVNVAAVCDVDQGLIDKGVKLVQDKMGNTPKQYKDFRELLDKEKPEICIVATPDHWHPLIAIAAVNAGAHVYVEKPVGHTIMEGRAMVQAVRASDRVMQVGLHRRVTPHGLSFYKFIKGGGAGKIGMVRAFVTGASGMGQPDKPSPNQDPPPGLDWDMWCGPAPYRPYNAALHPLKWRQFLEYANGQLGDWVHWIDQIYWVIGDEKQPTTVSAVGGIFIRDPNPKNAPPNTAVPDGPDTLDVHWQFDDCIATWEHRQYANNNSEKAGLGCYFYGTKGVCHIGWNEGWTFYPANKKDPEVHDEAHLHNPGSQSVPELWADFIDAIQSKRRPVADIEIGHHSTTLALLGMLSYKLGRSVKWDGQKEQCVGDPEANKLLRREYRAPWKYPEV